MDETTNGQARSRRAWVVGKLRTMGNEPVLVMLGLRGVRLNLDKLGLPRPHWTARKSRTVVSSAALDLARWADAIEACEDTHRLRQLGPSALGHAGIHPGRATELLAGCMATPEEVGQIASATGWSPLFLSGHLSGHQVERLARRQKSSRRNRGR